MSSTVVALRVSEELKASFERPKGGWLRAVRQLYGLSVATVAAERGIKPQVLLNAEIAEAEERITMQNFRAIADAMGFDVLYCLVPRKQSPADAFTDRVNEAVKREMLEASSANLVLEQMSDALAQSASFVTARERGIRDVVAKPQTASSRRTFRT